MSLYPTYVLTDSGEWFRDPVIRGDGWFLCFDEDEPPELVVRITPEDKPGDAYQRGLQILKDCGIKYRNKGSGPTGSRCFGSSVKAHWYQAISMFVEIIEPIPRRLLHEKRKPATNMGLGTFLRFGSNAVVT